MDTKARLKALVTVFLCCFMALAWIVNAIGAIKGTFHFEPHWSLIVLFLFVIGGGVFDISIEALSLVRGFLKRKDEIIDLLKEEKHGDAGEAKPRSD